MKAKGLLLASILFLAIPAMAKPAHPANARGIWGQYVEFRNADVYTGPCFAMAEVGLTGEEAILAWHVDGGAWAGVPLEGLNVVAVVRASATLGDPYASPLPARTVFLVDARASRTQQVALVSFVQAQTGGLLNQVVAIQALPISFTIEQHGWTSVEAGQLLKLSTRAIGAADHFCHNEEVYYQPMAGNLGHAMPVAVRESTYSGNHLGITWHDSGRRSSFVGTFAE